MTSDHQRNTAPMLSSLRCRAKTRSGKTCQSPAVNGKKRCRMHGGAEGSGAPEGNQNALKHGRYTKKAIEERRELKRLIRESGKFLEKFES
ncbi:MAG: HGGxSTG domain-containing protein [Pseudolabrys sp.]|nr:HGGxSTG domain-containing protein [Pseudolabrys sp.]